MKERSVYDESGDVTLRSVEGDAEEKRRWDLLNWRPRLKTISAVYWDFGIPKDAYEACLSLMEPEDRATLEHAFSCKGDGKLFKYRFFGSDADKNGDMDWRSTASACARTTMDADSALRLSTGTGRGTDNTSAIQKETPYPTTPGRSTGHGFRST